MTSSPKLSLSKLPCKPKDPEEMETLPPFHSPVSIPFHWEEAPGKPRTTTTSSSSAATAAMSTTIPPPPYSSRWQLDLPPGLLNDAARVAKIASPPTILDGPYVGRTLSRSSSFSFRKVPNESLEERGKKRDNYTISSAEERSRFGSSRWGSYKDVRKVVGGSFDFSLLVNDVLTSDTNGKKMGKIRRRGFLSFSSKNSMWASVKGIFSTRLGLFV